MGWANGSMSGAGIILPGNLNTSYDYDFYNYVTNPGLPLVAGLPATMDHNYASHEDFSNLPAGATIYCVDSEDDPTLIEFSLGAGWVIISGQPLEHQYEHIYGNSDMEELLPRIVAYFTGNEVTASLFNSSPGISVRASHLE